LILWCEANSQIPDDVDQVFCGAFVHKLDKDDKVISINIFLTRKNIYNLFSSILILLFNKNVSKKNFIKLKFNKY